MHTDTVNAIGNTARAKVNFMKGKTGPFFLMAMMAGLYIGLGCCLMLVIGGAMTDQPFQKLINGLVFSVGLCMVMMAGAELFTGNNMVMAVGVFLKTVTLKEAGVFWLFCWIGNLVGSVITGVLFTLTGIPRGSSYVAAIAEGKMNGAPLSLFSKAIFCNICVCVAIWCGTKLKSEGAKIAMAVVCVVCFVTSGFEHSIANMTFLTIGLLNQAGVDGLSIGGMIYNLVIVTFGNIIGGVFGVALPYYLAGAEK